jgi:hypothetical protein
MKRLAFPALVALAILTVSLVPWEIKDALGTGGIWHRYFHFGVFAAATLAAVIRAGTLRSRALMAGAVLLLAFTSEAAEFAVYRMAGFEWFDMRDDTAGILTAFAVVELFRRFGGNRNRAASGR